MESPSSPHEHLVLVVEDQADAREALTDLLREEGVAVRTAANGAAALGMLDRGLRPCLILLDMLMPLMSGWAFRQGQLQSPALADIPVALVSGAAGLPRASAALGVDAVTKPVQRDRLLELVRTHCPARGATA